MRMPEETLREHAVKKKATQSTTLQEIEKRQEELAAQTATLAMERERLGDLEKQLAKWSKELSAWAEALERREAELRDASDLMGQLASPKKRTTRESNVAAGDRGR